MNERGATALPVGAAQLPCRPAGAARYGPAFEPTSTRIFRPSCRRSRSRPRSIKRSKGIVSTHSSSGYSPFAMASMTLGKAFADMATPVILTSGISKSKGGITTG